jgi:hypothetical protein
MGARRVGLPGRETSEGILTAIEGRRIDGLIKAIEADPFGPMIDLVMLMYQMSGNAMKELAAGVEGVLASSRAKWKTYFPIPFPDA